MSRSSASDINSAPHIADMTEANSLEDDISDNEGLQQQQIRGMSDSDDQEEVQKQSEDANAEAAEEEEDGDEDEDGAIKAPGEVRGSLVLTFA